MKAGCKVLGKLGQNDGNIIFNFISIFIDFYFQFYNLI